MSIVTACIRPSGSSYRNLLLARQVHKNPSSPCEHPIVLPHREQSSSAEDSQLSLFPYSSGSSVQTTANAEGASLTTSSPNAATSRRDSASTRPNTNVLSVQEIVAETLKQQQKPSRKVVEVRIFFDDGTFETFSAH